MINVWIIVPAVLVLYLLSSIKILREYERGVVFRLGRVLPQAKGPGIVLVFAPIDRLVRMSLRIEALEMAPQQSSFNCSNRWSSCSCLRMYVRICISSRPTVDTKYPRAQKC